MKVITYLGFTVLSIVIQFCVMDFIQEKIKRNENAEVNVTNIYQNKEVDDLLKNISSKPHALFYRTHMNTHMSMKRPSAVTSASGKIYNNSTEPAATLGSTDVSTTIFDILYEENTSTTEGTTTTEAFITTTEFENVTEVTYFDTTNKSTTAPKSMPKIRFSKYCSCNLLYKVCDVNCCCDPDCTSDERKHFDCETTNNRYIDGCISHLLDGHFSYESSMLNSVFCVVKTNLPDKRNVKQPNLALIGPYYKWKRIRQEPTSFVFKKSLYNQTDPIWLLKNGTISYLDLPTPIINNYCTDRAPIMFLKEEKIRCLVKLKDLEMFHISTTIEEFVIISATENTFNSSALNCSSLHCINWTVLACENGICKNYNSSLYEASCTESGCQNVALKLDYNFYYYDFKVINATIKLHMQNISNVIPFISQEITVKFIMTNKTMDNVIEFSGNPGYIYNLPIIAVKGKNNLTDIFFNSTSANSSLYLPGNEDGMCVLSNASQNAIKFGVNKRLKCRYVFDTHRILTQNSTRVCKSIQDAISKLIGLNTDVAISPFGNPYGISDENWIKLKAEDEQKPVYGGYSERVSSLQCYNLINRVAVTIIFANVDEEFTNQNKILMAMYETVTYNASFNMEDISTVLTIDINFVDATRPNLYVYAGSPHLNIHLPSDFFFPFPPNKCLHASNSCILTILCCIILFFANKITLE